MDVDDVDADVVDDVCDDARDGCDDDDVDVAVVGS